MIMMMMMMTVMVRMMRFCFFFLSNTFFTDLRLSKAGLRKEGFPSERYLVKRIHGASLFTLSAFAQPPDPPALWEELARSKSIFDEPLDHLHHSRVAELVRQHVPEMENSTKSKNNVGEIVST